MQRPFITAALIAGSLSLAQVAQAQGDTCSTSLTVPGGPGTLTFNNDSAGTSGFDGGGACGAGASLVNRDLFWTLVFPASGTYEFNTFGSTFDTKLSIHSGADCSATCLGYNDDTVGLLSQVAGIQVQAGDEILVQVGGFGTSTGSGALNVRRMGPSVTFAGLNSVALGSATLTQVSAGLLVDNLGSSGEDGIAIGAGGGNGMLLRSPEPLLPTGSVVGDHATMESIWQSGERTSLQAVLTSQGMEVVADFSNLGATARRIEAWDGDQLVAQVTHSSGPDIIITQSTADDNEYLAGGQEFVCVTMLGVTATMPDGAVVNANRFVFRAVGVATPPTSLSEVHLTGQVPYMIIAEVPLVVDSIPYVALGSSTLTPVGTDLFVGNIGSSGLDGVRLEAYASGLEIELDDVDEADVKLEIYSNGQSIEAGTTSMRPGQGGIEFWPDYSPVGVSTYTVQILLGNQVIHTATGISDSAPVLTSNGMPDWIIYSTYWYVFPGSGCGECEWDDLTTFSVGDGTTWTGTKARIFPENGPQADLINSISLSSAAQGAFTIQGASVLVANPNVIGTEYCMANVNSTGVAGSIEGFGSLLAAGNSVRLVASDLPLNSFGFFITSPQPGFTMNPGGSAGNLCLSGAIGRYVGPGEIQNSGDAGQFELSLDLTQTPSPTGFVSVQAGEVRSFQAWYRDSSPTGATSNFTRGLEVTFQ